MAAQMFLLPPIASSRSTSSTRSGARRSGSPGLVRPSLVDLADQVLGVVSFSL
jgi:hypothetical protein